MDDGYCISQLKEFIDQYDILGVIVACTDQSAVLSVINKIQKLQVPFGLGKKKKLKKHLSIVSFTQEALKRYNSQKPTDNEKIEKIELMRALDMGMNIKTFTLKGDSFSVDVKKDFLQAKKYIIRDKFFNFYK